MRQAEAAAGGATPAAPDCGERARQLAAADLAAPRCEFAFSLPRRLQQRLVGLLKDERDAPQALLLANIALTTLPAALALHALGVHSHAVGAAYMAATYVLYLQRFLLTLHFSEHRQLFRAGWLNLAAPYLLSPLFGVPSGAYRLHHVVMHHVEDNAQGWDLSSTEPYQRDSLLGFLHYWLRFALLGSVELPLYALRRGRAREAGAAAASMAAGWLLTALLWRRCWVATLYTLVLPYAVSSLALMFGNWSQHVFVDPAAPADDYKLTYNCLACPDNARTYNDGYHVLHHANSRLHWSELPAAFVAQLELHDERDALAFRGIGFFDVGLAVFCGRLGWLADHIVPCGPRQASRTHDDWVALLAARLQPVGAGARAAQKLVTS